MRMVSIEQVDNEYVVYTVNNPNWKSGVFTGSLSDCQVIATAYLDVGYTPCGQLAKECYIGHLLATETEE